jgi:hypothetical protein
MIPGELSYQLDSVEVCAVAEASRTKWEQWRGFLWPLGATVLSLIVLPVAIEQYPEFFRDNKWILPGSVILVLACWTIPLFVHHRAQKLYSWIIQIRYVGWLVLPVVIVCVMVVMWVTGARLFRFHRNHLDAAIRERQPNIAPLPTSPQPQSAAPSPEPPIADKGGRSDLLEELAKRLREEEEQRKQPITKKEILTTVIPFAVESNGPGQGVTAEIPHDLNGHDPLFMTYSELNGISYLPTWGYDPQTQKLKIDSTVTDEDRTAFLGRTLQYFILRSIAESEATITHYAYEQGVGTTSDTPLPVDVPDVEEYPIEKLDRLWPAFKIRLSSETGHDDWRWKEYKLKVPIGTSIRFIETPGEENKPPIYSVRLERKPDFHLDFKVMPVGFNKGIGTFPKHFVPLRPDHIKEAFACLFTISMEFQWNSGHFLDYKRGSCSPKRTRAEASLCSLCEFFVFEILRTNEFYHGISRNKYGFFRLLKRHVISCR